MSRDIIQRVIDTFADWAGTAERAVALLTDWNSGAPFRFDHQRGRAWAVAAWLERKATGEWPMILIAEDRESIDKPTRLKKAVPGIPEWGGKRERGGERG